MVIVLGTKSTLCELESGVEIVNDTEEIKMDDHNWVPFKTVFGIAVATPYQY